MTEVLLDMSLYDCKEMKNILKELILYTFKKHEILLKLHNLHFY